MNSIFNIREQCGDVIEKVTFDNDRLVVTGNKATIDITDSVSKMFTPLYKGKPDKVQLNTYIHSLVAIVFTSVTYIPEHRKVMFKGISQLYLQHKDNACNS